MFAGVHLFFHPAAENIRYMAGCRSDSSAILPHCKVEPNMRVTAKQAPARHSLSHCRDDPSRRVSDALGARRDSRSRWWKPQYPRLEAPLRSRTEGAVARGQVSFRTRGRARSVVCRGLQQSCRYRRAGGFVRYVQEAYEKAMALDPKDDAKRRNYEMSIEIHDRSQPPQ